MKKIMKKLFATILIVCLGMTLLACNQSAADNPVVSPLQEETRKPAENKQNSQEEIISKEPIVISETGIYDMYQVQIVMTKGYYNSSELSSNPNVWYGDFLIRVVKLDEIVSEEKINFNDNLEVAFPYSFQLHAKDLNQDEAVEVAIGQYISAGKVESKLYSIDMNGVITTIDIEDKNTFFIAGNEISPEFEVTKEGKVKYQSFIVDKDGSENIREDYLIWRNNKFIKE